MTSLFLKAQKLPISTGGRLEVHLNPKDAASLKVQSGNKIRISIASYEVHVVAEINANMKQGTIGLVRESVKELVGSTTKALPRGKVQVHLMGKPDSLALIRKKMDGKHLSVSELEDLDQDIVDYTLSDVEVCYFISACYMKGMSVRETADLTISMVSHGEVMKHNVDVVVDKHCIGGVPGNRTTLAVIPIMVALGYTMPKTSSRSITSPAGTADTIEVLANVELSMKEATKVVRKTGGCMIWGGGTNVAPSDDRMIAIRHSMHLDPKGLLLSSVIAKKVAMGSNFGLIDIPYGPQAKVKTKKEALKLGKEFEAIGKAVGIKLKSHVSVGVQPGGYGIGPALEMRDVLRLLANDPHAPRDYYLHALELAADVLHNVAGISTRKAYKMCKEVLENGKALEAFSDMLRAQGTHFACTKKNFLEKAMAHVEKKIGTFTYEVVAEKNGVLKAWDIKKVASVAFVAGSPSDQGAGVAAYGKIGDSVKKGDMIMIIHSNSKDRLNFAIREFKKSIPFTIS